VVIKHDVAIENLKPLVEHYVKQSAQFIDSQLRNFVLGEKKKLCLTDIFEEPDNANSVIRINVVESLLVQYREAGWEVEQAPDDDDGNIVLTFK